MRWVKKQVKNFFDRVFRLTDPVEKLKIESKKLRFDRINIKKARFGLQSKTVVFDCQIRL